MLSPYLTLLATCYISECWQALGEPKIKEKYVHHVPIYVCIYLYIYIYIYNVGREVSLRAFINQM